MALPRFPHFFRNSVTALEGKCRGCDAEGEVGEPCDADACAKRDLRFIPKQYHESLGEADDVPDPLVGRLVGDFLVVQLLEVGGFGKVYLALQEPMFRLRGAMKVLEFSTRDTELADAMAEKFRREAEVLAEMSHPQIVRLLKYGIHRERPYLVMEYVEEGGTLREEINTRAREERGFGQEELGHIFRQMLNGLEAAHEREIIHRDLKPDNIMLQEVVGDPYHVRILDFGIAKFLEDQSDTKWPLGSPSYMAPEQVSMKNLGTWTDMYALGVMFFELATGRRPFPGGSKELIMSRKASDSFDPFERIEDLEIPEPTLAFMRKAIEPEPEDRLRTVEEFRTELEPALDALVEENDAIGPGGRSLTYLLDSQDIVEVEHPEEGTVEADYSDSDLPNADVDSGPPAAPGAEDDGEPPAPPAGPPAEEDRPEDDSPSGGETPAEEKGGAASAPADRSREPESEGARSRSLVVWTGVATFVVGLGAVVAYLGPDGLAALYRGSPGSGAASGVASAEDAAGADTSAPDASDGPVPAVADATDTDAGRDTGPSDADAEADTEDAAPPPESVVQLAAGKLHTCARRADGRVQCWGDNADGQLGLGHTDRIGDDEPASASRWLQFDAPVRELVSAGDSGSSFNCALLERGAVRCWGDGSHGQLGYGDTESRGDDETLDDLPDVSIDGTAVSIAAGASEFGSHTCALLDSGDLRCWGKAKFGKLGYGHTNTIGDDETPDTVGTVPVGGAVREVAAGKYNTCAILEDDTLRCWGWNKFGQLGLGHTRDIGDDELPASTDPIDVGGTVADVAVGRRHVCARLERGAIRCWGWNEHGQLGIGRTENIGDDETPASTEAIAFESAVETVGAGSLHVCALLENGDVVCWGDNRLGQLGRGDEETVGDDEPAQELEPIYLGGEAIGLAVGRFHNCALLEDRSVRCWGLNGQGQLGYGHTNHIGDDEPPGSVSSVPLGD